MIYAIATFFYWCMVASLVILVAWSAFLAVGLVAAFACQYLERWSK